MPLAVADKSPHGSRSVRSSSPPNSSSHPLLLIRLSRFRPMSPLRRQSTVFLQSISTKDLNSEAFWIDGVISSAFHEETLGFFGGVTASLDGSPAFPTDYPLPSFDDDHFGPPSAAAGDVERVSFADFTLNTYAIPFDNQPVDLYATFSLSPSLSVMTTDCTFIPHRVALTIHISQPTPTRSRTNAEHVTQHRR